MTWKAKHRVDNCRITEGAKIIKETYGDIVTRHESTKNHRNKMTSYSVGIVKI
jgi:hypothetical protein